MKRTNLPPLNGLRAFEAAARHMSFTRAAAELNVTQSAISHQVRALEARLQVQLFRRLNRANLVLTETGQLLMPVVRDAFEKLAAGVERVLQHEAVGGTLTLSVSPSFAAKWLMPRLERLRAAHPELELHISASTQFVDFDREDVDAAIRHGLGRWDGLRADRFLPDEVFPICSPALLAGPRPLAHPEDLVHHVILRDTRHDYWEQWLDGVGLAGFTPTRQLGFDDIGLVVQAAIAGQGIGMGRKALVDSALACGRLVRPFAESIPADYAYHLVYPEAFADRPKIRKLRSWLLEESERDGALAAY